MCRVSRPNQAGTGNAGSRRNSVSPGIATGLASASRIAMAARTDHASSAATAYNYGWRNCEGNHPRGSIGTGCVTGLPDILEYHHDQGCAVIGGYRFRGGIQQLQGVYLFSDACTGDLFYGTQNGATWTLGNMVLPSGRPVGPQGFGEDVDGNVYVADANNGRIYKFTSDYIFGSGFEP